MDIRKWMKDWGGGSIRFDSTFKKWHFRIKKFKGASSRISLHARNKNSFFTANSILLKVLSTKDEGIIWIISIQWLENFIKNKKRLGVEWKGKSKIYKNATLRQEVERPMDLRIIAPRRGLTIVLLDKYFD